MNSVGATALPSLREEIDLLEGPLLQDGQPSWTLHDPVRNLFFQLDWPSFEILRRWHLGSAALIVAEIERETTLTLSQADVDQLKLFLQGNELVQVAAGSAASMAARLQKRRGGLGQWLLHNYLFFRVPLVYPDLWLSRWTPRLAFLFNTLFWRLTLLAAVAGVVGVYRDWDVFAATAVDMLSWEGFLAYSVTLVAVKILHELGHGVTAKRYGCRVPTMGVAFLVLWPVAYTDTNEVWKLTRRDQRLKVAGAGIITELTIAVWATLAWVWLPSGTPKAIAFLLSTTTWISTLVINTSPFMRFDGYFLLADFLGMPNLHNRSFALARWHLREVLFKLHEEPPEDMPRGRRTALILFAWATWIYRLVLFLGIAVLVYHFFIKAVGILLFLVEIIWFVAKPFWSELSAWGQRGAKIRRSRRARVSLLLLLGGLALFVVPWSVPLYSKGVLQPRSQWVAYAPENAQLTAMPFANGALVPAGSTVFLLRSPQLQAREAQSTARLEQLALQSATAGFNSESRRDWQILHDRQVAAQADQEAVSADHERYAPVATNGGILRDVDPDLVPGDWLARREPLGRVVSETEFQVVTYVEATAIHRIEPGDRGLFVADGAAGPVAQLKVLSVDRDASRTLSEAVLANTFGGSVQVREKQGALYPELPVYRVVLKVTQSSPEFAQHSWRGGVTISGQPEAPGLRFVQTAASVFWREFGF